MGFDARLGIGWALGMVDIPQPGNPTRAEQIVELLDFFGVLHLESLREKLFFTTKHTKLGNQSSKLRVLRTTVFENSRALRKFTYHHEGPEEHEVRNEISRNLLTFVVFVSFVVKISVFFGCGSPALGSPW